ncbi:M48 metallopeptidase family protein [Methanolobus halotolerans]|uniref:Metal-dependent hydrolase n=1 Tax=Methanolobus halotolerans TaxID=2052935 RepID=A0A4E0PZS8_9EURY|nr:M48 family metallopeptidase [Methanolobus halotolerans]TGC11162.1 metal-dependent hydrolase [Methanolobus halotolerans]
MEHSVSIKDDIIKYHVIHRKIKTPRLEFREGRFNLIIPKNYPEHEKIILRHRRWIYNRYVRMQRLLSASAGIELEHSRSEEELKELVGRSALSIGKELGVQPNAIRFRKMRTKWGSCSSGANINFNTYMRYLPEKMIEYVVYHEMVHLIELNHSPCFWSYIRSRFKDHKNYEEELANYWFLIQEKIKA